MKFHPKSKEELASMSIVPAGVYRFKITDAVEQRSSKGNDMIRLSVTVEDNNGHMRIIFDYLLEAMPTKLYDFCEATSMLHHYSQGTLRASDCVGRSGMVEIVVDKGKEKPEGGLYPDKNTVKKYMAKDAPGATASSDPRTASGGMIDDDIPF